MVLMYHKQHKTENLKERNWSDLYMNYKLGIIAYESFVLQFILHFPYLSLDVSGLQQS